MIGILSFIGISDARWYDPQAGRFINRDPIGFAGGDVNLYRYVGNSPVNYVDPLGLHTVGFSGTGVLVVDNYGEPIAYYPASSGTPGHMKKECQCESWKGPIPEGNYSFNPTDFSKGGFFRNLFGDWGTWRIPLTPHPKTKTYGRKNFFFHGGKEVGSAGCVDLGVHDVDFYNLLKNHDGAVAVIVHYP